MLMQIRSDFWLEEEIW